MKTKKLIIGLIALVLIAAIALVWSRRAEPVDLVSMERRTIVERLVVTGIIEPVEQSVLSVAVPGKVLAVNVRVGDEVKEGQPLLVLDTEEALAREREAEAFLAQARARLRAVTGQQAPTSVRAFEQASIVLEGALEERARTEELVASGVSTPAELDRLQREVERARVALEQARIAVTQTSSSGSAVAEATAGIQQALASRDLARLRVAEHTLRAPFEGVVLSRQVERGQTLQAGAPLFRIATLGAPDIRVEPDERELANLRPGLSALVVADAFPDQPFEARIDRIDPVIDRERATVAVYLRPLSPTDPPAQDPPTQPLPEGLRPEMTVSADIELGRTENVQVLPLRAIRDRATPQPYVLVIADDRAERVDVKLGISSDAYVEILEGLDPNASVILNAEVEQGQRVSR